MRYIHDERSNIKSEAAKIFNEGIGRYWCQSWLSMAGIFSTYPLRDGVGGISDHRMWMPEISYEARVTTRWAGGVRWRRRRAAEVASISGAAITGGAVRTH
jgi:hypothetical protein